MYYDHTPQFLDRGEIRKILSDSYFYLNGLIFVLDKYKNGYDLDITNQPVVKYQQEVEEAYRNGKTLVVRGLENYNDLISGYSRMLGVGTDVHMYLVPRNGDHAFGFHTDEREVVIHGVYGEKDFEVIREGVTLPYSTKFNCGIVINCGEQHRAIPKGESAILSFGIPMNYKLRKFEL
jgi:hypothetical protein